MQAFIEQEEQMIRDMVNKIADAGANVLFCQKGIDDLAQHYLAKAGIMAVRRVKKSDMEKLARATGATVVTNIEDLDFEDLGLAGSVAEKKISGEACSSWKTVKTQNQSPYSSAVQLNTWSTKSRGQWKMPSVSSLPPWKTEK